MFWCCVGILFFILINVRQLYIELCYKTPVIIIIQRFIHLAGTVLMARNYSKPNSLPPNT